MSRDDIIRMAREAGAEIFPHASVFSANDIERFAHLVAAAEREACAKMVEDWDSDSADPRDIAAAIRARNNT